MAACLLRPPMPPSGRLLSEMNPVPPPGLCRTLWSIGRLGINADAVQPSWLLLVYFPFSGSYSCSAMPSSSRRRQEGSVAATPASMTCYYFDIPPQLHPWVRFWVVVMSSCSSQFDEPEDMVY